jgi:hypothetical protein
MIERHRERGKSRRGRCGLIKFAAHENMSHEAPDRAWQLPASLRLLLPDRTTQIHPNQQCDLSMADNIARSCHETTVLPTPFCTLLTKLSDLQGYLHSSTSDPAHQFGRAVGPDL